MYILKPFNQVQIKRCHRSSAAVTPVKYEPDNHLVGILVAILRKLENNGKRKIGSIAPPQDGWFLFPLWRHQMEIFSALLALSAENSPVTGEFPHKGQWRGALVFSLICAWTNGWVNDRDAGDMIRHRAYYDVAVMDASKIHVSSMILSRWRSHQPLD